MWVRLPSGRTPRLDVYPAHGAVEDGLSRARAVGFGTAGLGVFVDQLADAGLEVGREAPGHRLQNPIRRHLDRTLAQRPAGQDEATVVAELALGILLNIVQLVVELLERLREPWIATHAQVAHEVRRVVRVDG